MNRLLIVFVCLAMATPASAATLTFEPSPSSVELRWLMVENIDDTALAGLSLTIGDTTKNFDSARLTNDSSLGIALSVLSPDESNANLRSDFLELSFAGFGPGLHAKLLVDLDGDTGSQTTDWQTTLFNNGDASNAQLTMHWIDGATQSLVLTDEIGRNPQSAYTVNVPHPINIPEPASLVLALLGTLSAFMLRRTT